MARRLSPPSPRRRGYMQSPTGTMSREVEGSEGSFQATNDLWIGVSSSPEQQRSIMASTADAEWKP